MEADFVAGAVYHIHMAVIRADGGVAGPFRRIGQAGIAVVGGIVAVEVEEVLTDALGGAVHPLIAQTDVDRFADGDGHAVHRLHGQGPDRGPGVLRRVVDPGPVRRDGAAAHPAEHVDDVAADSDPRLVEKLLLEAAREDPDVLDDPAPGVRLFGFGENGMKFELRAWSHSLIQRRGYLTSKLNFAIYEKLKAHKVNLVTPQREIFIHNPADEDTD